MKEDQQRVERAIAKLRSVAREDDGDDAGRLEPSDIAIVLAELDSLREAQKSAKDAPKKVRPPSATEIAEAVSAKLKSDAHWAEVDAYYRDRAKR